MRRIVCPTLIIGLVASIAMLSGCTDANLKKARRHQREKDYDGAIHYYKLVLEKDPENRSARYSLVEAYAQQLIDSPPTQITPEKAEEAMTHLRPIAQPLMGDPNIRRYISLIHQMLAKRYAEEGRHDKAGEAWTVVTEIEPSFAEAHFNLGVSLVKLGQYEDALSHFEKAVGLNPYFSKGYHAMGNVFLHLTRYEDASKQFLRALEINPDDPSIHHSLGTAYFRMGDTEKAVEEYEKALEIEPGYMLVYLSLHGAYLAMGETEKAEEAGRKWNEFTEALVQAQKGEEAESTSIPEDQLGAP
ncbi:MAG: tetratricopeptide repeat protein, partial [Candidatus Hydrogenedentota bacterium]